MRQTGQMRILAVDTAEQSSSVAVVEDGVPICEIFSLDRMTHSKTVMDMVVYALEERAKITIKEVDGFVVASGPGSFTGLRIGISIIKGLAFATSKPSAGVSSLDGVGYQFSFSSYPVCVMMDAKRGEIYCAIYNFSNGRLLKKSKEAVVSPDDALSLAISKNISSINSDLPNSHYLFVGSGAVAFQQLIQDCMGNKALFAPYFQNSVKASALADVVFQDSTLLSLSPDAIKPIYLRRSDAEINYAFNKI
ncbi:MAG: tRNA (adenosine(37)-N6)-threonylcarbamoyltransferase complex dimerization subunit type 1 TsaB [Desulfamplus sp.]|nr:tRNA (adenosine(37)-N6)-threonylcarbamoyltransferase complex dimerization subunit type 1 TsaB [Desulfamplus sp.]